MQAARDLGVSRVVHLSSTAVFGLSPGGGRTLTEDTPLRRTGNDICDGKIAGERVALEYHRAHGLPVCVLRPTVVFGPFGYYSDAVARTARAQRLVLVDGARGVCNCLYVDNLIQAMILAAEREHAVGQVFHISDAEPVRWGEYLQRHAAAVDEALAPVLTVTSAELAAARRRQRNAAVKAIVGSPVTGILRQLGDPAVKSGLLSLPGAEFGARTAKRIVRGLPAGARARVKRTVNSAQSGVTTPAAAPPRHPLDVPMTRAEVESFSVFEHVTFSIDKARRLLGYAPAVDFDEGMARTAAWIRWANI
jgi:nucleoside-diphosphate-sugar epimerase